MVEVVRPHCANTLRHRSRLRHSNKKELPCKASGPQPSPHVASPLACSQQARLKIQAGPESRKWSIVTNFAMLQAALLAGLRLLFKQLWACTETRAHVGPTWLQQATLENFTLAWGGCSEELWELLMLHSLAHASGRLELAKTQASWMSCRLLEKAHWEMAEVADDVNMTMRGCQVEGRPLIVVCLIRLHSIQDEQFQIVCIPLHSCFCQSSCISKSPQRHA